MMELLLNDCSMTEDFVIKYLWSACGYALMSIPLLFPNARQALVATGGLSSEVASRTESESCNTDNADLVRLRLEPAAVAVARGRRRQVDVFW